MCGGAENVYVPTTPRGVTVGRARRLWALLISQEVLISLGNAEDEDDVAGFSLEDSALLDFLVGRCLGLKLMTVVRKGVV